MGRLMNMVAYELRVPLSKGLNWYKLGSICDITDLDTNAKVTEFDISLSID